MRRAASRIVLGIALATAARSALATDGVIEINMARAAAGGVTSSDSPGFPVTIDTSGSYRLTGDLTVASAATTVIEVTSAASEVTIDLNGFAILGPVQCHAFVCSPTGSGYGITGAGAKLEVVNGAIRGMGVAGVYTTHSLRAHALRLTQNGTFGIISADMAVITDSIAESNGADGIYAYSGVIRGCSSDYNGQSGITTGLATVADNSVVGNKYIGINANAGSTVTGNSVNSNHNRGIQVYGGSSVTGNAVNGNTLEGIYFLGVGGYANDVLTGNNGGGTQVGGGASAIQTGINICGTSTTCP